MAFTSGSRLGPYEIVAPLGAGGMGEVYRARDTKLNRYVAIKVLPEAVAADPERLARFEREAQALAALNHPNIAAVYAVEGRAIVMELVEGEDLSAHIARGPVPLAEALPLARQIVDALAAAHEAGIIHRDLKPANIKVKGDGTVKVLDFGLAKALEPPGEPNAEAMNSPTLTARATRMGVILGTAAYMAPEQARGKVVDKRADIWAFGVVLYEMLAGRRPFDGDDVTDVLAAVVRAEPDWTALPTTTPPLVRRLLVRCLTKDTKQRLHDIGDARLEIDETVNSRPDDADRGSRDQTDAVAATRWWRRVTAATLLIAVTAALLAGWMLLRGSGVPAPVEYDVALPDDAPIAFAKGSPWGEGWKALAISPIGDFVVYIADRGERSELWYRSLLNSEARAIQGTEGAYQLAIAPDGGSVAFISGTTLKVVTVQGGTIQELGRVTRPTGVAWYSREEVVVGAGQTLTSFPLHGGTPRQTTTADFNCYNPMLPSPGEALCGRGGELAIVGLGDGKRRGVRDARGSAPEQVADGYLLYSSPTGLLTAGRWQPAEGSLMDQTVLPLRIRTEALTGARQAAVSASGALVYVPGGYSGYGTLVRRNPSTEKSSVALSIPPAIIEQFDVTSDGRRLAVTTDGVDGMALTVYDLQTSRGSSWLAGYLALIEPRWSPDGTRLVVSARRDAKTPTMTLVGNPAAAAPPEPLGDVAFMPSQWYDQTHLLGVASGSIVRVQVDGRSARMDKIESQNGFRAMQSPDGRLIAYMSGDDIVVETLTSVRTRTRIERGQDPVWRDKRTLIYRYGKTWFTVVLDSNAAIAVPPAVWFSDPQFVDTLNRSHTVSSDGTVLYVRNDAKNSASFMRVIPRWVATMKAAIADQGRR